MRALIVDDSKAMRTILRKIVADCGFDEVVEAENGVQALVHLRKTGAPDLVLVDWNMPEMTGIEFITRVRKDDTFDTSMLMMVTTETEPARITEALVAGADEYVMKPFTADALREKIDLMRASKS
jgi:two-component system, chemotaxis family, chemotaxis protein CheY